MSKESALQMLSGTTAPVQTTPGLLTHDMPTKTAAADPAAAAAVETPKDNVVGLETSRLAIFAKKEAALLKEREAFKAEREAVAREKAEAEAYRRRGQEFDEISKKDKIAALRMIGWTETDIVNAIAGTETAADPTPEERAAAAAEAKIAAWEKAQEDKATKQASERNLQTIQTLKKNIADTITNQAEKFEFCSIEGAEAEEQVYEIIEQNLIINKELLTVEQALEIAEELYEARDKAYSAAKKRAARGAQTTDAPVQTEPKQAASTGTKPDAPARGRTEAPVVPTIPLKETRDQKKERLAREFSAGKFERRN